MVVPARILITDEQTSEDYRRLDKLLEDMYDVLCHILVSKRSQSSDERIRGQRSHAALSVEDLHRRNRILLSAGQSVDTGGLNGVYPDLVSTLYRPPIRTSRDAQQRTGS